jgi:hypothetical protein
MNNGRDCEHGQLARSCDRCADAAEIAELRKELAAEREHMAELEALARHEADCAEAYKAEAESLRAAPWVGTCQACGHQHEAGRPKPLSEDKRIRLFIELNAPCVQAESPSAMFALIVQAVERAHGIGA